MVLAEVPRAASSATIRVIVGAYQRKRGSIARHNGGPRLEILWNQLKLLIGDILFRSPDNGGAPIVNGLGWRTRPRGGEAQVAIHLPRLHCLKIEASDFIVDFFCHLLNVEHDPLFWRVATPDIPDGTHNDRITFISHGTNGESVRNILST
jgi:hypothetical protein